MQACDVDVGVMARPQLCSQGADRCCTCSGRLMSEGIMLGHVSKTLWLLWPKSSVSSFVVCFPQKLLVMDPSQAVL